MLRVIAGKHSRRKLLQPKTGSCKPTQDRVKEAVFSMIQFRVKNSVVLDLFAGSGALGIECVSRGATKVFCVDKAEEAVRVITRNVQNLQIPNLKVVRGDAIQVLDNFKNSKFDLIFLDPPYNETALYNLSLSKIHQHNLLKPLGYVVVECQGFQEVKIPPGFVVQKRRKYGTTSILLVANNI